MTSSEISPFAPAPTALAIQPVSPNGRFDRLEQWCRLYMSCSDVAKHLAATPFVPKEMGGKPETVAASMLKGLELDVDPLDALGSIYVVHGRPGFYAEFQRRRVIEAGHEFEVVEATDTRAKVRARRKGAEEWIQQTFTADQAKKAGINLGSYPADKLVARATTRMVRYNFPDVLAGTVMVEDLEDQIELSAEEAQPIQATAQRTAPAKRTARRTQQAPRQVAATTQAPAPAEGPGAGTASEEMPPLPGDDPTHTPDGDGPDAHTGEAPAPAEGPGAGASPTTISGGVEMSTKSQQQKLAILLKEEGFEDRESKLAYLGQNFGREFSSSADLTKREASDFIDFLEKAQAGDQQ